MKNITITVDDEVALWARIWAARQSTSVSKLVGSMLAERMREESGYEVAMQRFLNKKPVRLRRSKKPYPSREALHERDRLR